LGERYKQWRDERRFDRLWNVLKQPDFAFEIEPDVLDRFIFLSAPLDGLARNDFREFRVSVFPRCRCPLNAEGRRAQKGFREFRVSVLPQCRGATCV
jgi:hypothetical protein